MPDFADDADAGAAVVATDTEPDGRELLSQALGILSRSKNADDHTLAKKILKLLHPGDTADTDEGDESEDTMKYKKESLEKEAALAHYRAKDRARMLCEQQGVAAGEAFIEAMAKVGDAQMRVLLEERRQTSRRKPKAMPPGDMGRGGGSSGMTNEEFKRRLLQGF